MSRDEGELTELKGWDEGVAAIIKRELTQRLTRDEALLKTFKIDPETVLNQFGLRIPGKVTQNIETYVKNQMTSGKGIAETISGLITILSGGKLAAEVEVDVAKLKEMAESVAADVGGSERDAEENRRLKGYIKAGAEEAEKTVNKSGAEVTEKAVNKSEKGIKSQ